MDAALKYPLDALIAVTLSAVTYVGSGSPPAEQRQAMNDALRIDGLPTGDDWKVVWGPATHGGNLAYIARGPDFEDRPQYAYAIRGTGSSPEDMLEDALDTIGLFRLPWSSPTGDARISEGAKLGWRELSRATDDGVTALEFFHGVETGSRILVTGHSLGGTLAKVMALYFRDELSTRLSIQPITFAAMTVGDRRFADIFTDYFGGDGRYYNCLDIVPMGFQRDELAKIRQLFKSDLAPKCSEHFACGALVKLLEEVAGHHYFHTPGGVRLEAKAWDEGSDSFQHFLDEAYRQHQIEHYLWLMGLPLKAIRAIEPKNPPWSPPTLPCECPS